MKVFKKQSGGLNALEATAISAGSTQGLEQTLLAQSGQLGKTVLAVGYTNTGKVQGVSLGGGNVVEVYASGADFSAGVVQYREFMSFGEPICFTGVAIGAIITATEGFYGVSENVSGANESPMPLLSLALSFTKTFLFAFRNSQTFREGTNLNRIGNNVGTISVVNGPIASVIKLMDGTGVTVRGQEGISLAPWEHRYLGTSGNNEYILESTNNIMACIFAHTAFYDCRLIMPLTNDGITWPRSGFISALYDNTQVDFYVRDGVNGRINSTAGTGVSPGLPVDFDAGVGTGTGADEADYEPNGATRLQAIGLISAYSGADSAGLEASPMMPTAFMTQVVAQPLFIIDDGDGGNSSIAIASPYEGTAKIYEWDDNIGTLVLAYTLPLTRENVTVTSKEDQLHPSAGIIANEESSVAPLVGNLRAGVIIADVPITVVVQSGSQTHVPVLRSQNGTTTTSIINDDDETLMLGVTPTAIAAEIREGGDGILYRRVIGAGGVDTWVVA